MRRVMLLVLGICGSIGAAALLCCSVAAGQVIKNTGASLKLPFRIEGTPLVVVDRVCYDGPFGENGSDREVVNVAAVLIRNTQQVTVASAEVVLTQCNGLQKYRFTMLPPGGVLLVPECDGQTYNTESYIGSACTFSMGEMQEFGCVAQITSGDRIAVTNTSTNVVKLLTVYYKTYDPQMGMYLGGITYQATAENIQPGEQRIVDAYHVAYGYTKVVGVKQKN